MEDQKIAAPYGDIFSAATPALDKLTQTFGFQQQQKQKNAQREFDAANKQAQSDISKLRGIDVPAFTQKYQDWANANKILHNQPDGGSVEDQMAVNKLKSDAYDIMGRSITQKALEKNYGDDIKSHPNLYKEGATTEYANTVQTPIDKIDLTDNPLPKLKYQPNPANFSKAIETASAVDKIKMDDETSVNKNEQRTDVSHVLRSANGGEFYNSLLNNIQGQKNKNDLPREIQFTPEQYAQTQASYNAMISNPTMAKRLGLPNNVDNLPQDTQIANDPAKLAAKYLAMQHVINHPPVITQGQPIYDRTSIQKSHQAEIERFASIMQNNRFNQEEKMAKLRASLQNNSAELANAKMDRYIQGQIQSGTKEPDDASTYNPMYPYPQPKVNNISITPSPAEMKGFPFKDGENGKIFYPTKATFLDEGKQGVKLSGTDFNGKEQTAIIPMDGYKAGITNTIAGTKYKGLQLGYNPPSGNNNVTPKHSPKKGKFD